MQPRVDIITLGLPDLAAARRFYVDGLGWNPIFEVPGDIVFLQIGHGLVLGLWHADEMERDIDPNAPARPATGPCSRRHSAARSASCTASSPTRPASAGRSRTTRAG